MLIIAGSKEAFQAALAPGRGNIRIAWHQDGDQYELDGEIFTMEQLESLADRCEKLIVCSGWSDWNKPPPEPKKDFWASRVFYIRPFTKG